jgi:Protein of unknown function (DUF1580)
MPNYISPRQACPLLPGRPHINTVRRWMTQGSGGIKLRSLRFAGKRLTTEQWCQEFTDAMLLVGGQFMQHHEAEAKLDKLGVG